MPVSLKVVRTRDFIKTTATGVLDLAASKEALLGVLSEIRQSGQYEVLVDTREAEVLLSIADIYELGEAMASCLALRRSKICLLVTKGRITDADFLEKVAYNRGVQIKAFSDFEQAITWLVMREEP